MKAFILIICLLGIGWWAVAQKTVFQQKNDTSKRTLILNNSINSDSLPSDPVVVKIDNLLESIDSVLMFDKKLSDTTTNLLKELNVFLNSRKRQKLIESSELILQYDIINQRGNELNTLQSQFDRLQLGFIGLVLLLLIGLFVFGHTVNLTRRKANDFNQLKTNFDKLENSKMALEQVNEELTLAQALAEQSNAELAKTRDQLEEKNNKLNDYLKELSHRVKNNLQDINSLLGLQATGIKDPETKKVLNQAQERIRAIGLIHKHLYSKEQKRLTTINFKRYIYDLVEFLCASPEGRNVQRFLDLQEIHLEISSATNIGLIINEVISNCFKHAFPEVLEAGGNPELFIKAEIDRKKSLLSMSIKDNGPGIRGKGKNSSDISFGQSIISALVEHENGEIGVLTNEGTEYQLSFPLNKREYILG